ncbi:hypothetical protein PAMA_008328 [Pampus argenteus]
MMNCRNLLNSVLVTIVLMTLAVSALPPEKIATCCKQVSNVEITEPITGYMIQERNLPCVRAIIFQTESGLYCSQVKSPWVPLKIREFLNAKAKATPSSPVSLLSIITSTASPPAGQTSQASFSTSNQ